MNLKITETQAKVIRDACELFSRLHMGQLSELKLINSQNRSLSDVSASAIIDWQLTFIKTLLFPGLSPDAYHGIQSPEIPDTVRIAYDLHQVIRKALAGEKPEGSFPYVQYDPPIQTGGEPLAEVEP